MNENRVIHTIHQMPAGLRLFIAVAFAGITFLVVKNRATSSIQFMALWLSFALVNLVLYWTTMATVQPHEIMQIAKNNDTGRTLLFLVVLAASLFSLIAIVL